jgi:hypothetical protein
VHLLEGKDRLGRVVPVMPVDSAKRIAEITQPPFELTYARASRPRPEPGKVNGNRQRGGRACPARCGRDGDSNVVVALAAGRNP